MEKKNQSIYIIDICGDPRYHFFQRWLSPTTFFKVGRMREFQTENNNNSNFIWTGVGKTVGKGWGRKTEFYNFSFSKFPHDSVDLKTFGFSLGKSQKNFLQPDLIDSFCFFFIFPGSCDQPLGMESGDIPDSSITATSSYVPNVGPQNGR